MNNKLSIILCDDDNYILKNISEKINSIIKRNNYPAEIVCMANNAKELFEYLNDSNSKSLYFLDIHLGENMVDGIQIAHRIKNKNDSSKIVFITNFNNRKEEVLLQGTESLGFIEKNSDTINQNLDKYIKLALQRFEFNTQNGEYIDIKVGLNNCRSILTNDILYIETNKVKSHGIIFHLFDGQELKIREKIENVYLKLGESFMFSHRGVIINKKHVIKVENNEVLFSNGYSCVCSGSKRKEVIQSCLL